MYKLSLNSLLIIVSVIELGDGLNILVIMPNMGRSHQLVYEPMFEQLVRRGHNLTVITAFPRKNTIPNWRDIWPSQRESLHVSWRTGWYH
ncbi:hypothetical protein JTB14_025748 [Gonioctena quinquepunctata]|nr:hypothetical protein JTB14_025748 [Gonioctena quinquepunctata]